jgi:hypothetical protein
MLVTRARIYDNPIKSVDYIRVYFVHLIIHCQGRGKKMSRSSLSGTFAVRPFISQDSLICRT